MDDAKARPGQHLSVLPLGTWAIALLLSAPKVIALELPPEERGLEWDHLLLGLLEEGYEVAAPRTSRSVLIVRTSSDAIHLTARAAGTVEEIVPRAGRALEPLDLLHRALDAIRRAGELHTETDELRAFAVHLDDSGDRLPGLLEQLARRLLRADSAWVSARLPHDDAICIRVTEATASLSLEARASDCAGERPLGDVVRVDLTGIEETDRESKVAEAARHLLDARTEQPSKRVAHRPPPPAPVQERPPPFSVELGAGVLSRGAAPDPAIRALLTAPLWNALAASVTILGVPSAPNAGARGQMLDLFVGAGPSYAVEIQEAIELTVSVSGGMHWHHFSVTESDSGNRFDWVVLAEGGGRVPISTGWSLGLSALVGKSGRERRHELEGVEIWSRSAWFAGVLASVSLHGSI